MKSERAMRIIATVVLASLLPLFPACSSESGGPAPARSSAGLPQGDVGRGQQLAQDTTLTGQSCVSCHGDEGNAPIDPSYPRIAGQYADYLAYALQGYRDGKREHMLMTPQAAKLGDRQIADLAAYFASRNGKLRDMSGL